MKRHRFTIAGLMAVWLGANAPGLPAPAPLVPNTQPETYGVATLLPAGPHRFFVSGFQGGNFDIINGDTGRLEGSIPRGYVARLAIAPDKSRFYVSETYWTHGRRGTREDLLSVYDATTLNLLKEINLPSRMLSDELADTQISADGSKAYIYIMHPASPVVWVDLRRLAVGGSARTAYLLSCGGCHGEDGVSNPVLVPELRDLVGYYLLIPEGRRYLAQLPNVAFSSNSDRQLAALLNYVVFTLGGGSAPRGARPYSARGRLVARQAAHRRAPARAAPPAGGQADPALQRQPGPAPLRR